MLSVALANGCKNTNDFAKLLGYTSPEKLYRLERNPKAKPSVDILSDFSNKFVNVNMRWILTGETENSNSHNNTGLKSYNTPISSVNKTVGLDVENTSILHPTTDKILHPTLHPTRNLGLPRVVTVTERQKELISLVPVKASAGYLEGYGDSEYVEELPTISLPNIGIGTHRAFEIKGSSMNPTFHNKSIVIARWVEDFDEIRERRIYVVVTKEHGIVAKRVLNRIEERGVLTLISDNNNKNEYGNFDVYPEDVIELWYVRANLSFEFPEPDHSLVNRLDDLESSLNNVIKRLDQRS